MKQKATEALANLAKSRVRLRFGGAVHVEGERTNRMALEPESSVPTERSKADYDADAIFGSRSAAKVETPRSECGRCHKMIYRETPYPGVPSEWRHVSSGQPVSWQPTKHIASLTSVGAHTHHFPASVRRSALCTVKGCDAELRAYKPKPSDVDYRTARDKADDVSRKRGNARSHVTQGHKTRG